MRPSLRPVLASLVAFAAAIIPLRPAPAQPASATRPHDHAALRGWLALGIGPAGYYQNGSTTAFRAAANVTYGRAAALLRASVTGDGIDGYESASERSFLAGWRFGGRHFYVIPAAGFGLSHWHNGYPCSISFTCSPAQEAQYDSKGDGFAHDIGLHASTRGVGLAVNFSGISGEKRWLSSLAFSVELGRFRTWDPSS